MIGDTPVRLDLIDVTDATGRFRPPSAAEMASFRDALTRHVGQPVVRRYSGGKRHRRRLRDPGRRPSGLNAGVETGQRRGVEVPKARIGP